MAASAGGVRALSVILAALPADFPAPILICQHVSPDSRSHLAELLSGWTPLHVKTAADGDRLEPGWVYVTPSARHLLVCTDDTLLLSPAPEVGLGRPCADLLFSSLAHSVGRRAIAVVLTGTGWNGRVGVQEVRAVGGITIAQDEESSLFPSMPSHAAETGAIDYVLPLTDIAAALLGLTRLPQSARRAENEKREKLEAR